MKRQEFMKQQFPELKKKLEKEEAKRKEKESMETIPDSDDHRGI
jgi:hypothetical protein